jgi:hypothetical protein
MLCDDRQFLMPIAHHIGLELSGHSIRLVEMRATDGYPTILRVDVEECPHPFGSSFFHRVPFEAELAKNFIAHLTTILHRRHVFAPTLSLVIPTNMPLVTTLPFDPTQSVGDAKAAMDWECRKLLGLNSETTVMTIPWKLSAVRDVHSHLIVGMPGSSVDFLYQTLEHLTFTVHTIDVEHFVIEQGIRQLLPEESTQTILTMGMHAEHLSASLFHGEKYHGFRGAPVNAREPYIAQCLHLIDRLLLDHPQGTLHHIHVFGPGALTEEIDSLENLLGIPVHPFHPLSRFSFLAGSEKEHAEQYSKNSFTGSICAAWKGLRS